MRHLDIRNTPLLNHMPLGIGELKNLQTLSKFTITSESGSEITKLKDFKNLRGTFSIMGLSRVQNAIHAHEANFPLKKLSEFEIVWSDMSSGSRNQMLEKAVLNEMNPSKDYLKQLKILSYGGSEFPNWVGDHLFIQLRHVSIRGCKNCTSLPPLGQLQSLNELFIEGLDGVKEVGSELLGAADRAFSSLQILSFKHMPVLEKWSTNVGVVFSCLQSLNINDCPNLNEVSLEGQPSLNVLEIIKCCSTVLIKLVEVGSSVTKLEITFIYGLNDVVWRSVIEYLRAVEDLSIKYCNELRYLWESRVVASNVLKNLRKLKVTDCDHLVSLGEKEEDGNCGGNLLTSLKKLEVSCCYKMEHCGCPGSIEKLTVLNCISVTTISLSAGDQKLKSLDIRGCNKLLQSQWGGQTSDNYRSKMPMLEDAFIRGWTNLKSIVELHHLVHLTTLYIFSCVNVESFPDNELSTLISLKHLLILNCPRIDACFPRGVWPPNLRSLEIGNLRKPIQEWGQQNFPVSLFSLSLHGGEDGVRSFSQFSHLLPSSLTSLGIYEFKVLKSVSLGLQHLTSLQSLFFNNCPNLKSLLCPQPVTSLRHLSFKSCPNMVDPPEMTLSALLSLRIRGCPNLKERCNKKGCYWPLISHLPCIETDTQS